MKQQTGIGDDSNLNNASGGWTHQSHKSMKDEWLTPPSIFKRLGEFDLDPCESINPPWHIAKKSYNINDDGLKQKWIGRVFCNPPYGSQTELWLKKMSKHNNGIMLIFARTETKMFFDYVWEKASAILLLKGRLYFHHNTGKRSNNNSGSPSALIAYNEYNSTMLKKSNIPGIYIDLTYASLIGNQSLVVSELNNFNDNDLDCFFNWEK